MKFLLTVLYMGRLDDIQAAPKPLKKNRKKVGPFLDYMNHLKR